MDIYSKLYWLTRLDAIREIGGFLIGMGIAAIIISFLVQLFYGVARADAWDAKDDVTFLGEFKAMGKKLVAVKIVMIICLILGTLIYAFIPTKNEMIVILAGGKTIEYIQSDTSLNKIPYQTTEIISKYLDQKIEEMEKEIKSDD